MNLLNSIGAIVKTGTSIVQGITSSTQLKSCNSQNSALGIKSKEIIAQIQKAQQDFQANNSAIQQQIQEMQNQVNNMNAQIQQANSQSLNIQQQLQQEQVNLNKLTEQLNQTNNKINDLMVQKQYLDALPTCQQQTYIIGLEVVTAIVVIASSVITYNIYKKHNKKLY